jgi:hypothetical protein
MAAEQQRVPIDVHLNGDLATVRRRLAGQGVEVGQPLTATGPLAVLSQLVTPADVPVGAVVRPVVVGGTVVGFHVETSEVVANLRRVVLGRGQQPGGRPGGGRGT